jgi:cytochrome c-type biogenesis protein
MKFFQKTLQIFFVTILFLPSLGIASIEDKPEYQKMESDMVLIPAGQFIFGTNQKDVKGESLALGIPKPWYADEGPEQKSFLKGYYIDRFEVTNARYKNFIDDLGAIPPGDWKGNNYPEGRGDFPVIWTNWFDAVNFCEWAGKRLPTEKEWERAARGLDGKVYPWGNVFLPENANLIRKLGGKSSMAKVGSYPNGTSAEGVHDLIGNAWEWVSDDYKSYKGSSWESPDYDNGYKVARGHSVASIGHFPGSSYLSALEKFARSGYRQQLDPEQAAPDLGFRCVSQKQPKIIGKGFGLSAIESNPSPDSESGNSPEPGIVNNSTEKSAPSAPFNPFEAKPDLPEQGIFVLAILSLLAGLFSFLSPCTLPILPAYFAITAQADRSKMSLMSFAFFCGLATLFVLMGASASFLGSVLRDYMLPLTQAGGILVIIFGIMTLVGMGFSGATFRGKPAYTFFGFYLFGAAFALGWTPCVGPVLSGILIMAASEKTIFQGMTLLFFYAVGLGVPLILFASFFSHLGKDTLFWKILRGKAWDVKIGERTFLLHTTNLFSGALLIFLGIALYAGYLTYFNSLLPIELQIWFTGFEEKIMHLFE